MQFKNIIVTIFSASIVQIFLILVKKYLLTFLPLSTIITINIIMKNYFLLYIYRILNCFNITFKKLRFLLMFINGDKNICSILQELLIFQQIFIKYHFYLFIVIVAKPLYIIQIRKMGGELNFFQIIILPFRKIISGILFVQLVFSVTRVSQELRYFSQNECRSFYQCSYENQKQKIHYFSLKTISSQNSTKYLFSTIFLIIREFLLQAISQKRSSPFNTQCISKRPLKRQLQ
eukprot:TRINITY_DN29266_c1_g1_i3.p1 TRINITY_DN29266_c1_g1~~TRINITY_DN29266_c1_g1_i3.p1  ORF type:complete len:233 (-),score=-9.17 TRINITY_DN29266_c1_g1_i3:72-770(-)